MVEIVGHRGAGKSAPENTLLSFKKAIEIGCDRTELDVRLTKDKHVVVIHNKDVMIAPNTPKAISDMTLREVLNTTGELNISTLQEVIDLCKGRINIQIELKAQETPKIVSEILHKNDLVHNVRITSFHLEHILEIKRINPQLIIGYLLKHIPENIFAMAKDNSIEYVCPKADSLNSEFVDQAHKNGLKVYTWHANDEKVGRKAIEMGVDAIGTDFPELFLVDRSY